ncbi:MAG: hypothetical protein ACI4O7_13100 [Aristaeellaceae bacterium]
MNVHDTVHFTEEDFEAELPYDQLPVEWQDYPSGMVLDPETGTGIPGVTVTAYCILLDENDPEFWDKPPPDTEYGELWDASEYSQQNPLLTGEDGSCSWDVPEGWWSIRFEKDGYETSWSEWMSVPPIQTEVDIVLPLQAGFTVSRTTSDDASDVFVITNNCSSAGVLIVIAACDGSGNMAACASESAVMDAQASVSCALSYASWNVAIVKVFLLNPETYAPLRNAWKKAFDKGGFHHPEDRCVLARTMNTVPSPGQATQVV